MSENPRVRIKNVEILSNDWFVLRKTTFDYLRNDGRWQTQSRETYDKGNGVVILLYNCEKKTVILTKQFRFPTFVNGLADGILIEACAGLLDGNSPEECIKKEIEEETGYHIDSVRKIFEAYMSPGSVTEKLYFFVAEYSLEKKVSAGGGNVSGWEDIEVFEITLNEALHMIEAGKIIDGKTIMLRIIMNCLQHMPANKACTRLVGVGAFSGSLCGSKLIPSKWRCLVSPTSG
jgi:nudix-type nucleoside diphosphatase (YffH/AdpP family)